MSVVVYVSTFFVCVSFLEIADIQKKQCAQFFQRHTFILTNGHALAQALKIVLVSRYFLSPCMTYSAQRLLLLLGFFVI